MLNNVLTHLFNYELNQASPVRDDFVQVRKFDEDGNVFTAYEKFDYPKLQASLGLVKDWSLESLLKAGINPEFGISTGLNTRLEGTAAIGEFAAAADSILSETDKKSE